MKTLTTVFGKFGFENSIPPILKTPTCGKSKFVLVVKTRPIEDVFARLLRSIRTEKANKIYKSQMTEFPDLISVYFALGRNQSFALKKLKMDETGEEKVVDIYSISFNCYRSNGSIV